MKRNKWKRTVINNETVLLCESKKFSIKKQTDGYYLINENDQSIIDQVGLYYDTIDSVIQSADQKLSELKIKERNTALNLLKEVVTTLKQYDCNNEKFQQVLRYLSLGLTLPSSHVPQYVNKLTEDKLYKALYYYVTKEDYELVINNIYRITTIDPHTQSAITNYNDMINGRHSTIERLVGVTAVNEKGKLSFKKAGCEKLFESLEDIDQKSENLKCDGVTIIIQEYDIDVVIDLIFVNDKVYMILNDNNNDYHDLIDRNKNVLSEISGTYNIDLLDYIKDSEFMTQKVNEAFGGIDRDGLEEDSDDTGETTNTEEDDDELSDIVEDVDPEIQREIEIIENNIARIEDLPDDIRENDSIKEIYLLLLGKKEEIQREHDNQKSQEIVDTVVNDITSELGDIDIMFNKDNDSNEIKVEEGKVIEYNGSMIKPMVSNKLGKKSHYLIVENKGLKTKHNISGRNDITKIIKSL